MSGRKKAAWLFGPVQWIGVVLVLGLFLAFAIWATGLDDQTGEFLWSLAAWKLGVVALVAGVAVVAYRVWRRSASPRPYRAVRGRRHQRRR